MKKEIKFQPAWDKRSSDLRKDYGIHGSVLHVTISDEKGAVNLVVHLNWFLPQNRNTKYCELKVYPFEYWQKPSISEIIHHSPTPTYHEQDVSSESCYFLGNKPCYISSSFTFGNKLFELLISEGEEKLFDALIEHHNSFFKRLRNEDRNQ